MDDDFYAGGDFYHHSRFYRATFSGHLLPADHTGMLEPANIEVRAPTDGAPQGITLFVDAPATGARAAVWISPHDAYAWHHILDAANRWPQDPIDAPMPARTFRGPVDELDSAIATGPDWPEDTVYLGIGPILLSRDTAADLGLAILDAIDCLEL